VNIIVNDKVLVRRLARLRNPVAVSRAAEHENSPLLATKVQEHCKGEEE
jgi:hypothetical protein